MRLLPFVPLLAALALAQPVDETVLFIPVVKDLGRYLQTGNMRHLARWKAPQEVQAQLAARHHRPPWSESTPPQLRLQRVVLFTPGEAVLAAEESTIGSVMLRQSTPILIRLRKIQGQWQLVDYQAAQDSLRMLTITRLAP